MPAPHTHLDHAEAKVDTEIDEITEYTALPFPPLTKTQILNCSFQCWHPRHKAVTPKARVIPLSDAFVSYLKADGIFLPPDEAPRQSNGHARDECDDFDDGDEADTDPSQEWPDIHAMIQRTIRELGGSVTPKLNWSAPKDATWINATNNMECRAANDVYLLLKSSDFVTHDLEQAFDGCIDDDSGAERSRNLIPFHLVLRKHILFHPSVEFRCFVRNRTLLGICQRDLNHFDFLFAMRPQLLSVVSRFFEDEVRGTFPDENFVFDVYIPPPHERVWLIDFNPWAPRTDPLLYSWLELLTMPDPRPAESAGGVEDVGQESFVRLSLRNKFSDASPEVEESATSDCSADGVDDAGDDDRPRLELRLIKRDDPEAYSFNTPQYSAHKLPRDVVDASSAGPGPMRDFADQWREVLARQEQEDAESEAE